MVVAILGQVPSVAKRGTESGLAGIDGHANLVLVVVHKLGGTGRMVVTSTNRSHNVLLVGFFPIIPDTDIGHQGDGKSDRIFHHAFDDIPRHRNIGFGHFKNQFVVNL